MANAPRSQKIQPRIEPIKGSVTAGPVPGDRQMVEQPGQEADGRRSDQSAHREGLAISGVFGGPPAPKKYVRARY